MTAAARASQFSLWPRASASSLADAVNVGDVLCCSETGPYFRAPHPSAYAFVAACALIPVVIYAFTGLFTSNWLFFAAAALLYFLVVEGIAWVNRRGARAELRRNRLQTLHDAATYSQLAAKLRSRRRLGFDSAAYFQLAGPDAPRVIFLDHKPRPLAPPRDIFEEVDLRAVTRLTKAARWKHIRAMLASLLLFGYLIYPIAMSLSTRPFSLSMLTTLLMFLVAFGAICLPIATRLGLPFIHTRHVKLSPGSLVCTALKQPKGVFSRENSVLVLRPSSRATSAEFHRTDGQTLALNYSYDIDPRSLDDLLARWSYPSHQERQQRFPGSLDRAAQPLDTPPSAP